MSGVNVMNDWSIPFNEQRLNAFDEVVNYLYNNPKNAQEMLAANQLLNEFKQHPDAWMCVDQILAKSQNPHSKFLALQILDEAVNTRWKVLPDEQKQGIRQCIIQLVLQMSEDEHQKNQQHLITKLNVTLVSIVKQEWLVSWKNFITDICQTASQSQAKCENTLNILKLLSEEVFDFSKNTLLQKQAAELKETLTNDFKSIFQLCEFVITQSIDTPKTIQSSLIRQCLKTLQAFLSWIPLGYIFQTDLVEQILRNLIQPSSTRIEAIKLFTEISQVSLDDEDEQFRNTYKEKTCLYYCIFIEQIQIVTKNRDLREEFKTLYNTQHQSNFEYFCKQVCLSISSVLQQNMTLIETTCNTMDQNQNIEFLKGFTNVGLQYMIQCTNLVPPEGQRIMQEDQQSSNEIFKTCMEFWHYFAYDILQKSNKNMFENNTFVDSNGVTMNGVNGNGFTPHGVQAFLQSSFMHSQVYPNIMDQLRESLLDHMAKPKEVLVEVDENGNAVQVQIDDVETIHIYEQMRETLIFLTNIDSGAMDKTIQSRLDKITTDKEYFSFDRLNKLCWALGSISGTMSTDEENQFVVSVVKELLNLCEKKQGKSNKALVASNIMYVVGQFPNFLNKHWPFLKTVIKKLNEFMHEKHPGVQDMAAETFLKISKLTKHMFTQQNEPNYQPYVVELITMIPENCKDLEYHQKLMVYEGLGHMISTEQVKQQYYIQQLLSYTHSTWQQILQQASQDKNFLMQPHTIQQLIHIIKINQRVAISVGNEYLSHLSIIFNDLIMVYKYYSECISQAVAQTGTDNGVKPMKTLRKDILALIQTYIEKEEDFTYFNQNFLPTLQAMIEDFSQSDPNARDSETLMLFAIILKKEGQHLENFLSPILIQLCQPTLQMIMNDLISFPEFREGFFKLVQNIIKYCTQGLFKLDPGSFQCILQSVVFSIKHQKPELMEIGLKSLWDMNDHISNNQMVCTEFYINFYSNITKEILLVMTDCRHLSGFKLQGQIFQQMIKLAEETQIQAPIKGEDGNPHTYPSNKEYAINFLRKTISEQFPNMNASLVETYCLQLFNNVDDWKAFKGSLRDLRIEMNRFSAQGEDFYEEERKIEKQKAVEKENQKKSLVPGMNATSVNGGSNQQQQALGTQGPQVNICRIQPR